MRGWLVPMLAVMAWAPATRAQDAAVPVTQVAAQSMDSVRQLLQQDKLMPALAMLEKVIASDPTAIDSGAQIWAFSGDVDTADALFLRTRQRPDSPLPDLSQARPEPAIEAIVRAAEGKRVVMINEAHHSPRHRAFSHQLMLALRKAGFTHFAAETFCNGCQTLLAGGAPTRQTGYYTMEPVFGDLARQAAAAGYKLVGYEMRFDQMPPTGTNPATAEAINHRERAQAENLKAQLDADPAMRVLVHVGFGHLNETSPERATHLFGGRLKELGEDPLTVDQIEGTPQADAAYDSALYRAYVTRFGAPAAPVVLVNDPAHRFSINLVDLSVIHPTQHEVAGRPDWLAMDGYRRPYAVVLAPLATRSLVRAFVVGEPAGAIAMDQMLVEPGAAAVTLMLPAGDYRVVRQTEAGENLPVGEVHVP